MDYYFYDSLESDGESEYECETCPLIFTSYQACLTHMEVLDHMAGDYKCETCNHRFSSQAVCNKHMDNLDHWAYRARFKCDLCSLHFKTQDAANSHMNANDHWAAKFKCATCSLRLPTGADLDNHMKAQNHGPGRWQCTSCKRCFWTLKDGKAHEAAGTCKPPRAPSAGSNNNNAVDALTEQTQKLSLSSQDAAAAAAVSDKNPGGRYCKACDRTFQSENCLRMHLRGRAHCAASVACPFCARAFTTAAGVAHHLEAGACGRAPHLDRAAIHRLVAARDTTGAITEKLLAWDGDGGGERDGAARWDPYSAWNGHAYECYVCHKRFRTPHALRQHVESPVHRQKLYHCPNGRCARLCPSLAALFNHLESESCGYVRFERVQKYVGDFLNGNGPIEVNSVQRIGYK